VPKINAVVTILAEHALAAAHVADRAVAAGEPPGPLHGVPFTAMSDLSACQGPDSGRVER
jgi:aspartyl-tRNA(Asn)/glutamyl-tRNA(Gln) amidotransferase subunit A